jgi:hypothetical protein
MASLTRLDDCSVVAFITTIPPKPIMESISPVFPSERFSIFPLAVSRTMAERLAGNMLINGTLMAVVSMNFLRFMIRAFPQVIKTGRQNQAGL